MKWFILNIIAITLFVLLMPINLLIVTIKEGFNGDYFRSDAVSLDRFGNRSYRTLFNLLLIKKNGYQFGKESETISSVLGKNQLSYRLKPLGKVIVFLLNLLEKNHCIKSIDRLV